MFTVSFAVQELFSLMSSHLSVGFYRLSILFILVGMRSTACGVQELRSQTEVEPAPLAVEAQSFFYINVFILIEG